VVRRTLAKRGGKEEGGKGREGKEGMGGREGRGNCAVVNFP